LTLTSTGWGLPPLRGIIKVSMTLAKIAMVKRVSIPLISPANL
jgi:hypothetical protein